MIDRERLARAIREGYTYPDRPLRDRFEIYDSAHGIADEILAQLGESDLADRIEAALVRGMSVPGSGYIDFEYEPPRTYSNATDSWTTEERGREEVRDLAEWIARNMEAIERGEA